MPFYFVFIYFLYAMTPILFTYNEKKPISLRNTSNSFQFLLLLKHKQDACKEMINYFCCFFRRQCEKSQDLQRGIT